MATKFEKLPGAEWRDLRNRCAVTFLHGPCYEFALALSRGLDWPIVGLMTGSILTGSGVPTHAFVRDPSGKLRDARGIPFSGKSTRMGRPFEVSPPYILKNLTEDDLRKVREISEIMIHRASLFAQTLWPELPWKTRCFRPRMAAFVNDLEVLCRKHGVWIREFGPNSPTIVDEIDGNEGGFIVRPALNGPYLIERYFK